MGLAENLLNSLPETDYANSRIAGTGSVEEHIVVDSSRNITVPNSLRLIAVKGDKNIETVTIDCIRFWDGQDLSQFDVYINCTLPNGDEVTYIPEEKRVQETYFSFDWVIESEITQYVGTLTFCIVAKLKDDEGNDVYQWGSLENSDCSIADGGGEIYVPDAQTQKDVSARDIQQERIVQEGITEGEGSTTDSDEVHIVVNNNRTITVPNSLKLIAVKGDKDVETITVDCIRYWDGNDLSTFAVYINYILPNGNNGTYIPESIIVNDDVFSFDFVIGRHISSYVGAFTFWIVAKKTDDDANIIYQWSSLQNSECRIENGGDKIYVPEEQTDRDVISQAISVSRTSAEIAENAATRAEEAAERAEGGATIEVDTTLTQSGKAADAKVTGDRLTSLEQWMENQTYEKISITSFSVSKSTYEMGEVLSSVTINWKTNKTPTKLTLDGNTIDANKTSETINGTFSMDSAKKSWTLEATGEKGEKSTKTASISFLNGVYYGVSEEPNVFDSAFILKFTKELRSSKLASFNVDAGNNLYIFYCVPTRFGTCNFSVGGWEGGFFLAATIPFTNSKGYTEPYYIYRSDEYGLGDTLVSVK